MTIDEAISLIKQYIDYNNPDVPDFYTMEEACEVVINALQQEPCDDAVSRQAAIEAFGLSEKSRKYGGDHSGYDTLMKYEIQDILEDLPSVTPQPKMGRWISYNWNDNGIARWGIKCDQCYKEYRYGGEMGGTYKYCPNCGSKMSEIPTGEEGSDKECTKNI